MGLHPKEVLKQIMQLNNEGGAGMNEEEDEEELGHHLNND
jgi:hypothetical protein